MSAALGEWAGWLASAGTMLGAGMTAANLGARITGWGFAAFALASAAWIASALATGQDALLVTNAVLLGVNLFGVWRWLGRRAAHETAGQDAARRSRHAPGPDLVPLGSLIGAAATGHGAVPLGTVVEAMATSTRHGLAYCVIDAGSDTLRAVPGKRLVLAAGAVRVDLDAAGFTALPVLESKDWPARR